MRKENPTDHPGRGGSRSKRKAATAGWRVARVQVVATVIGPILPRNRHVARACWEGITGTIRAENVDKLKQLRRGDRSCHLQEALAISLQKSHHETKKD